MSRRGRGWHGPGRMRRVSPADRGGVSFAELVEQGVGDGLGAEMDRLAVAVVVAAAGAEQAEPLGEGAVFGAVAFRVVGVVDLQPVEALVDEAAEDLLERLIVGASELDGVGEDGESAGVVDRVDGAVGGEVVLSDVGGFAVAEVALEGVGRRIRSGAVRRRRGAGRSTPIPTRAGPVRA